MVLYILLKVLVLCFPYYCKGTNLIRRVLKSTYFELSIYSVIYMLRHIETKAAALHFQANSKCQFYLKGA